MDPPHFSMPETSCSQSPLYSGLESIISAVKRLCVQIIVLAFQLSKIWKSSVSALTRLNKGNESAKEEPEVQKNVGSLKAEFLKTYGEHYGYPGGEKSIEEIRDTEFRRLNGLVYLDHAGATLYSESQMRAVSEDLTTNLYGNPHSQSDSSVASSDIISSARQQVLAYCNASPKEYKCIFTSGATAALKLVGETFPWSTDSIYSYTMENHNSVLGIREYALNQGATTIAVDIESMEQDSRTHLPEIGSTGGQKLKFRSRQRRYKQIFQDEMSTSDAYHLFAFPSECNFSGTKFDLELVKMIQEGRHVDSMASVCTPRGHWMVLLDAAKGCGTQPPDLSKFPADFVCLSFYKIFGYPTGLGALLVRTDAAQTLQKSYFGGGTVAASIADIDFVRKRESIEQWFEDGTVPFLSIAALRHGFEVINQLGISNIARHTGSLVAYTQSKLVSFRHSNGEQVCVLYGKQNIEGIWSPSCKQGPTVTFNLKRPDGSWVGYIEVEKLASTRGIQLRTGCFCNPGACSKYLELTHTELHSNFQSGHVCWDDNDIISGRPTGAVRVSFGYMSTFEDAQEFVSFIDEFFVSRKSSFTNEKLPKDRRESDQEIGSLMTSSAERKLYLESIRVYPIKSCAGFSVECWPLSDTGLLYDREWLVKSALGEVLTQKKIPLMSSIGTFIDREKGKLYVMSPNTEEQLQISLVEGSFCNDEEINLCGQRAQGSGYGAEVNEWFSKALGRPCFLVRKGNDGSLGCKGVGYRKSLSSRDMFAKRNFCKELSFVNEGQLLLVSKASVRDLNKRLGSSILMEDGTKRKSRSAQLEVDPIRFRPNLVISGAEPYEEDDWHSVTVGKEHFIVLGGCNRCQMINIDPQTGLQSKNEPLATLASYRRIKGKILFGILLMQEKQLSPGNTIIQTVVDDTENYQDKPLLKVGSSVIPERTAQL